MNDDNLIEEEDFLDSAAAGNNPDAMDVDGRNTTNGNGNLDSTDYDSRNVVTSGDVDAAAAARDLNTVKGVKNKKIPVERRTTTPYMTKYEKARVLGTRALQIRCVIKSRSIEARVRG